MPPDPQDATTGFYLPGPPGSDNGDYWVGDTVRVHTGTGPFDYTEVDAIVEAITITRDDDNGELIIINELKTLPPVPAIPCVDFELPLTPAAYYPPLGTGVADADGYTYYSHTGLGHPEEPAPFFGSPPDPNPFQWHFNEFMTTDAGAHNPAGWVDGICGVLTNTARMIQVGPGTATVYTRVYPRGTGGMINWYLQHRIPGGLIVTDATGVDVPAGSVFDVEVPDDGFCVHWIDLDASTTQIAEPGTVANGAAFDGWDWDPA